MSTLNPYILTFNCGRELINPVHFSSNLFAALPKPHKPPDILVLALQEVAPIAYSFLGGSYLAPYLSRFQHAVSLAAASLDDAIYANIINRNVGMTAIMVFVLQDRAAQVHSLETAGVGVGWNRMGNKGAVAIRMGYSVESESTLDLTFVSAHLAPMEDGLARRNEDWANIVRGLIFSPASPNSPSSRATPPPQPLPSSTSSSETSPLLPSSSETLQPDSIAPITGIYTPTTHLFLSGDLNYRTSTKPPTLIDQSTYPQPSPDDSYPRHYWHLLSKDQLTQELRAGRTLHGLVEAPVEFPPTYKYSDRARALAEADAGKDAVDMDSADEGRMWYWSQHRWPSWCDRILWLPLPPWSSSSSSSSPSTSTSSTHPPQPDLQIKAQTYTALPLLPTSDHRPVAASFSLPATPIPAPPTTTDEESDTRNVRLSPPFPLDPRWKERRNWARGGEVLVGIGALLVMTWEGWGILLAVVVGVVGGWVVIVRGLL